ncbi:MAG: hypothetical protein M3Y39_19015 [Chloroflexota bacterium]|nr:hypothetical protein [Chloroflexota bacterium]
MLRTAFERGGKVKGFKSHAVAFLGYLISHESYHRGEIGIILTQAGPSTGQKSFVRTVGMGRTLMHRPCCYQSYTYSG